MLRPARRRFRCAVPARTDSASIDVAIPCDVAWTMPIKLPFVSTPIGTGNAPSTPARSPAPSGPSPSHPGGLRALHGDAARPPPGRSAAAPRNAFLPKGLLNKAQTALHVAGHLGGGIGTAANLASAALAGAAGATSAKQAALGAAQAVAQAAMKPGTPVAAAMQLAEIGASLYQGKLAPRDAMVQGLGAALDLAGGLMPGPLGKVAKLAGAAVSGAAGASSLQQAATGAGMAVAGAVMGPGALDGAMKIAGIGAGLLSGGMTPAHALAQGAGVALDLAAASLPGPLGLAARMTSAAMHGAQGAEAGGGFKAAAGATASELLARMTHQTMIRG
jgi:hypothetical protein